MIKRYLVLVITTAALLFLATPLTARAALGITSVSPNMVSNNQSTTITVSGSDFLNTTIVSLDGFGNLATSFFSATTLTAVVPAGTPEGIYTVTVTNGDGTSYSLSNGLTVQSYVSEPTPTATTQVSSGYERPVIVISSYSSSVDTPTLGQDFDLTIKLSNAGQKLATNVVATFTTGDLIPRVTGGVIAVGDIKPDHKSGLTQPFTVSVDLWGKIAVSLTMTITYTDESGNPYSEVFTISLPIKQPSYTISSPTPTATSTPTPTPTPFSRPQLVVTNYSTDITPLQPGTQFQLSLTVQNVGNTQARNITMITGGGSASSGYGGTQEPGGTSGASGEFTNFAPLGSSNVHTLGDLMPAGTSETSQALIVNVSTVPGAYTMKVSFTYTDENNLRFTDDQVITLLVYRVPSVEVNFYQDPGILYTNQSNMLPLQIINMGRSGVVLGNMTVTGDGAQFTNNSILVGSLEPGGYFTMDAQAIPMITGTLQLLININYTDDFNQPQIITKTLSVEVAEMVVPEPGSDGTTDGGNISSNQLPETIWQKIWRFILGIFGMNSAPSGETPTPEGVPTEAPSKPIIVPPKG